MPRLVLQLRYPQVGLVTRESDGTPLRVVVLRSRVLAAQATDALGSAPPGGAAEAAAAAAAAAGGEALPRWYTVTLELTPQRWAGPGLLGCHVVPVR